MNNVFINIEQLPTYISNKYFKHKDLVSIDELICLIDDLDDDLELKQQELDSINFLNDYPSEEEDRELEVL